MSVPDRLSKPEFIALMAMLMATVAFSIDAMLPAMPQIAAELSPDAPNRAQLIITSFVLGLGVGTLFVGPISDAVGRKPVVLGGVVVYCLGAMLAWQAQTLELTLAARVLQGLGAAASRVVALAIIRDLYSGRQMAQIVSLVIVVFSLVPTIAPTLGAGIIALAGWRAIFFTFLAFSVITASWLALRQAETLPPARRRPLSVASQLLAAREVFADRAVRRAIAVQALCFATLFAALSTTQMVFDQTFGRGDQFPYWFGGIALVAASGGFLNSRIVMRLGMHRVVRGALVLQIGVASLFLLLWLSGVAADTLRFPGYLLWTTTVFFVAGLTLGNLNALALEPLGHVAGMAASIVSSISTLGAVALAIPIGLMFDGTPVPVATGILLCAALSLWLIGKVPDTSPSGQTVDHPRSEPEQEAAR